MENTNIKCVVVEGESFNRSNNVSCRLGIAVDGDKIFFKSTTGGRLDSGKKEFELSIQMNDFLSVLKIFKILG